MNLNKILILLLVICSLTTACETSKEKEQEAHEHKTLPAEEKVSSLSPHTETMAMVGDAHIHIDYSSPSVRDRIIFGGLVGYNSVWQAGAHNATWIETDKDLEIEGKTLPAGKYGFFLIPRKENEWSVIFNSRWEQHGKDDYEESEDVVRLEMRPQELEESVESLTYELQQTGEDEGSIVFSWEKKRIELPFKIK